MMRVALIVGLLLVLAGTAQAKDEVEPVKPVPGALPYTIRLEPVSYDVNARPPQLSAYAAAVLEGGKWLIVGGRIQGLHTFEAPPANNFAGPNTYIWAIDAAGGVQGKFDVNALPDTQLAAFLQSTNQQGYHDRASDRFYLCGGYGANTTGEFVTFDLMVRFSPSKMWDLVTAAGSHVSKAAQVAALFEQTSHPLFKVTGGELEKLGDHFYLVFGQLFDGYYMPFTGGNHQVYTEQIRIFTLNPKKFGILSQGTIDAEGEDDRPFHRRDGNIVPSVDAEGRPRITALGGVFPPGQIAGYTDPIHIDPAGYRVLRNVTQRLSQYECPVATVYEASTKTVSHTLFGGIGHYFYHLRFDKRQWAAYVHIAKEGRNDGLPFTSDISTLVEKRDGTWQQWIWPEPMPHVPNPDSNASGGTAKIQPPPTTNLIGSSTSFLPDPAAAKNGYADDEGIVLLDKLPKSGPVPIGWIYGGIRSDYPLPVYPNHGTAATNAVFVVTIERKPAAAIPGDAAIEATASPGFTHGRYGPTSK